ncbi:SAM-dependent methyltransferase [Streptomyces glaucosporus]|uniref:SAM-dependent methyltransferase n=1 Tax=Streptomyces glaucosporus TaxID=284044 RepID=UPI0031E36348
MPTTDDSSGREPAIPAGAASSARVYDAFGGGKDNYATDERIAREIMGIWPEVGQAVAANRAFIHASARWLAQEAGIRQFLDIGTGIPAPNTPSIHQTVQRIAPTCRVLYVDNDPTVLAHAATLRAGSPEGRTEYLHADATDPDAVLGSRELADTLDLNRPVALYLCALLHLIGDDKNPRGIVRRLTAALAPGSHVVVSHATPDANPRLMDRVAEIYARGGRINAQGAPRSREQIRSLLGEELELVEPGIVSVHRWQPGKALEAELPDSAVNCYALVARKP